MLAANAARIIGEFARWLADTPEEQLLQRRREADLLFHRAGITFTLYGDEQGTERLIPFDTIPRSIPAAEWAHIEAGCIQRVQALNLFLADLYHEQRILKAGVIPAEQVLANDQYQLAMQGLDLPGNVYAHIAGVDLVRDGSGNYYVLEDNLRTPSGVSYMLENRKMMMRLFPELFVRQRVAPIDHYPDLLLDTLKRASDVESPSVVVLTPGRFNSAYFEHAFLAREMGVELVEGADLFVRDERVYMRTTAGPQPVDVIYRRIDDAFLDPLAFNPDSLLGVPGLLAAYRAGNLVLANAIGTGVADDKSIYLRAGHDPLLPRRRPATAQRADLAMSQAEGTGARPGAPAGLVVKETQGSGGYGMLVGPAASREIELFRERLKARPEAYIAQPTLSLSTCPTFVESGVAPRHIDLRPFVLSAPDRVRLVPGGLTRVALREGSLVVNSSQGGGTRTPGWWRNKHAQPDRFRPVLDVALPGTRGEPRPHARRQLLAVAVAAGPQRWRPGRTGHAAADHRHPRRLPGAPRRTGRRAPAEFLRPRPGQPGEHLQLPGRCACQCPCGTRADHPGHVGEHQRHLAGNARHRRRGILRYGISRFCEWVKDRSHLFRGATFATSMRNDAFRFIRLGTFIERADNTLRLLDARYQTQGEAALAGRTRAPRAATVERAAAGAIRLRGLHRAVPRLAQRAQHRRIAAVARGRATFAAVLHRELSEILSGLPGVNGRPARRLAAELEARVRYTGIDEVLEQGLHTWITDYILLVRQLANAIHSSYLEAA